MSTEWWFNTLHNRAPAVFQVWTQSPQSCGQASWSCCQTLHFAACQPVAKACRQVSAYKRTLKLELNGEQHLHSRLVSLLFFLTNRRNGLQVCCVQHNMKCSRCIRGCAVFFTALCHVQGSGSAKLRCSYGKTMPCDSEVTCLEIHVRCQLPAKPSRFKRTAMAWLPSQALWRHAERAWNP